MNLKWPLPALWTHKQPTATEMKTWVTDALNDLYWGGVPTGTPMPWLLDDLPDGMSDYWHLNPAGEAVSRVGIYANLFALWGTKYGAGNGATTFNLPNLAGRFLVATGGFTDGNGVSTTFDLDEVGGTLTHTHLFDAGAHTHAIAVVLEKDTTHANSDTGTQVLTNATDLAGNTSMGAVDVEGRTEQQQVLPPYYATNVILKL